ncbi:hypothetical protein [Glycomyces tenuis]|uniref:hypothetical protein n=1 Tax=Glycomyces tenuis TaxID=58116 RepID=UPI0004188E73|nr:hypothetical protein [Glycomyces tenuis]
MSPIGITPAHRRAPRPDRSRRAAAAAAAAVAALALGACGEVPTGSLNTRAGHTIATDVPVSVCPEGDEARLADEEGTLIGAHFALRVECVVSFTEPPEGFQLEYLFGEDTALFPPPEGHEFTMVQFAPEPGHEGPYQDEPTPTLSAELAIGDEVWTFEGEVPAPGAAYLAVVPQDAPISLKVTDFERTQAIDLRKRERSELIQGLYHGSREEVTTDYIENSVDGYLESGNYQYSVEGWNYSTNFVVNRSVYVPGEGWVAELDRARLSVSFIWLHSGSGLVWEIDPEETLQVSGPDGALTATAVDHTAEDWREDGELRTYHLSYDVPADALQFTLEFAPKGPIAWPDKGVEMPISGEETHTIEIDFS